MKLAGGSGLWGLLLMLALLGGCSESPFATAPRLSAVAAQHTLNVWNPRYCKVAEFYGLYQPGASGATLVAYVSIVNPSEKAQKAAVYAATFQLLSRPDGRQQWFLTNLITHSSGILTRRQGWDNLMVEVQEAAPTAQALK